MPQRSSTPTSDRSSPKVNPSLRAYRMRERGIELLANGVRKAGFVLLGMAAVERERITTVAQACNACGREFPWGADLDEEICARCIQGFSVLEV